MPKISLAENQTAELAARGMLHAEAFSIGSNRAPVHLEILGDAQINRVSQSAVKLITGTGRLTIRVSPIGAAEFGPGTTVQVHLTRGLPGTAQETGAELPPLTLDGRQSTVAGTLTYTGDHLVVAASEGTGPNDTPFDGASATVRAGMRGLLNRRSIDYRDNPDTPVILSLDTSASMNAQVTDEDLELAVDLFIGVAGAIEPDSAFHVITETEPRGTVIDGRQELRDHVRQAVQAGAHHIGSGLRRRAGTPQEPTFAISDEEPLHAEPHGLTFVIGSGVRDRADGADGTGRPGVLRVTGRVRDAIDNNDAAALQPIYEHIVHACHGSAEHAPTERSW